MRSVDQFRAEYSRARHVGAEPDASHRLQDPVTTPLSRVNEFADALARDLQQLTSHHTVNFLTFLLCLSPIRKAFLPVGARKRTHWV